MFYASNELCYWPAIDLIFTNLPLNLVFGQRWEYSLIPPFFVLDIHVASYLFLVFVHQSFQLDVSPA